MGNHRTDHVSPRSNVFSGGGGVISQTNGQRLEFSTKLSTEFEHLPCHFIFHLESSRNFNSDKNIEAALAPRVPPLGVCVVLTLSVGFLNRLLKRHILIHFTAG